MVAMLVGYEVGDHIATITLNRPEARNALSEQLIQELLEAFEKAKGDDDVRVIVLTGTGNTFCAGADLAGLGAGGSFEDSAIYRLFTGFPKLGKPVIGKLQGHAIAGGLGLAVSCDLVIAADDVKLGTPEVNVGLWPMMIMAIINRNVAPKHAFELYYTGRNITPAKAERIGLITEAVPRAELDAKVAELARTIASKSPIGLAKGRAAFFAIEGKPLDEQIAHLLGELVVIGATDDAKEGIAAFLEKRPANFTGH
jgi:enoyl-CoA hydratase/carnithine racemase